MIARSRHSTFIQGDVSSALKVSHESIAVKTAISMLRWSRVALTVVFAMVQIYPHLYNNLAKPFTTVGADPFYGQTSGPRPPKFLQG
jgi:hypothetical protein